MLELTFIMGVPLGSAYSNFIRDIADGISEYTGGCTVCGGLRYWKPDACETKRTYTAETQEEQSLSIVLTVNEVERNRIIGRMRSLIVHYKNVYNVPVDLVHVQEVQITRTTHFSVKQEMSKMNASQVRDIISPGTRHAHA